MLTKLPSRIRQIIPLICLTFSLNLILTTTALGYEPAINFNFEGPKPAVLVQDNTQLQAFILLASSDMAQLAQAQDFIKANGGRTIHIFPYQAMIVKVSTTTLPTLVHLPGVAAVYTQAVELATLESYGPAAQHFAGAWNNLVAPQPPTADVSVMSEAHSDDHNDAFIAPDIPAVTEPGIAANASITPGYYQTSEYMTGSVAVGIVLVESNGSIDPSTENWTSTEKQQVFNEIMAGLNWWAQLEPRANLSFVYDDHFSNPLPTGVEPIIRPYYHQQYWIAEAMSALGYNAASYFTRVRDYNNALRTAYQTNWAFTIFVVDSSVDSDNRFSDGYFAYAYLGGPFMVMTYGNNGYGPGNMDAVAAHEMGHIFFALDQYASAYQPCTHRSGYLDVENQNSQYGGCPFNANSIMRGQIYPYTARAIDIYAAGQIGWRDSDNDNIFDPMDVELPITLTGPVISNNSVTASGLAEIIPYPAPSRTSVTINTLTNVWYRFDQGGWQQATASDGAFDETAESYNFTSNPLLPGLYTLEVAASDSAGNLSGPQAAEMVLIPDPADPGPNTKLYAPDSATVSQSLSIGGVAYHAQNGTLAKVEYRINGSLWQAAQAQDGAFDSDYESFTLPINALEPGTYLIETFATDTAGNTEVNFASHEIQVTQLQSATILLPLILGGM